MINAEVIKERLKAMDENLIILDDLRKMPLNKFLADIKSCRLAERCLEINVQCILDICHHIIAADNFFPRPKNNSEAIEVIARHKVIPHELAERILPMSGLRNILVHEYLAVDNRLLYDNLQNLRDLREFQKHILTYLKNNAG